MNSARSWVVFGGAVFAYLIGVMQRTSFGVAGVDATHRFEVSAAAVSTVVVVQIIVYASLQIPVGLLVDRFGPRVLIVSGAALMAVGQAVLAFSPNLGLAIVGRVLVGAGDAMTFISVIRLLPQWFGGRVLPQLSQWVGMIGQFGQILSAVPFALILHSSGWTPAFSIASGASVAAVLVAASLIRTRSVTTATGPIPVGVSRFASTLQRPGTQLGFWAHLLAGTAPTLMGTLWGYPFLTAGLGLDVSAAAGIFSLLVLGALVSGPLIGLFIARHPLRRSNLVLGVVLLMYLVWAIVLLWPGTPPLWLVALLFLAIGVGGPGSLVGFDFARTFNPSHSLGSASGIVNVGGFLGGFVSMFLIGVVLDLVDAGRVAGGAASDLYSFDSFRIAFLVPFAVGIIGTVGLLHARRRTRRRLFAEEGIEVAPLWVALFRSRRARRPSAPGD